MEKVIKKLKLFGATFGLATSIVCSSPIVLHAEEEEVLWENNQDDHHEEDINDYQPDNSLPTPTPEPAVPSPTPQITIDDTNWDPKSEPDAGLEIPDYVQTEAERKGLTTPTPEPTPVPTPTPVPSTPTPEPVPTPTPTPEPIPKTGGKASNVIFAIAAGLSAAAITTIIIKGLGYSNDEKARDIVYKTEDEEFDDLNPSCEDIAYSDPANYDDEIRMSIKRK